MSEAAPWNQKTAHPDAAQLDAAQPDATQQAAYAYAHDPHAAAAAAAWYGDQRYDEQSTWPSPPQHQLYGHCLNLAKQMKDVWDQKSTIAQRLSRGTSQSGEDLSGRHTLLQQQYDAMNEQLKTFSASLNTEHRQAWLQQISTPVDTQVFRIECTRRISTHTCLYTGVDLNAAAAGRRARSTWCRRRHRSAGASPPTHHS